MQGSDRNYPGLDPARSPSGFLPAPGRIFLLCHTDWPSADQCALAPPSPGRWRSAGSPHPHALYRYPAATPGFAAVPGTHAASLAASSRSARADSAHRRKRDPPRLHCDTESPLRGTCLSQKSAVRSRSTSACAHWGRANSQSRTRPYIRALAAAGKQKYASLQNSPISAYALGSTLLIKNTASKRCLKVTCVTACPALPRNIAVHLRDHIAGEGQQSLLSRIQILSRRQPGRHPNQRSILTSLPYGVG